MPCILSWTQNEPEFKFDKNLISVVDRHPIMIIFVRNIGKLFFGLMLSNLQMIQVLKLTGNIVDEF